MNREYLEWDSNFFGLKVEKIILDSATSALMLKEEIKASSADIIYIYCPFAYMNYDYELAGISKYDEKITYSKNIIPTKIERHFPLVEIYQGKVTEDLENIAYASGIYSRFFLDPKFKPFFKKLYLEWIFKLVEDENVRIFVILDKKNNRLAGMLSASINNLIGKIELLAVDSRYRGKGYGRQFMAACDDWCQENGASSCQVITQKINIPACRLYEGCDYKIIKDEFIYHYWK